ncbi:MAG: (d)CMP kinase [Oscillospiraceae bacterium]
MISVAIDGPAGAGKSTLAKKVAETLQFLYVDTGAMYRAIGLYAVKNNVSAKDATGVCALLTQINLNLKYIGGAQHIFLNGEDVSEEIRKEEISMAASAVSAHAKVRAFLLDTQRDMARTNNVVMDGRDIGTVILPNADVKIFLTASPQARAMRRTKELVEKGISADFDTVLEDVKKRDYDDTHREAAPLKQADDAVLVDTTNLDFNASFDALLSVINAKIK